jgi:OmpA-OmpF porin, OOP family
MVREEAMMLSKTIAALTLALALGAAAPPASAAQLGALRKKAEDARRKMLDSTKKADSAKAKGADSTKARGADTTRAAAAGDVAGAPAKADPKVWENYDFVPGNTVLFYTDFSEDKVGNFARGLKYVDGPAEIVERDGVKMLRSTGRSTFLIPVGRKLPQRFTLEIDVLAPTGPLGGYDFVAVEGGPEMDRGEQSAEINWSVESSAIIGGIRNSQQSFTEQMAANARGSLTHLRILMDSGYLKMYANEKRIYNIPEFRFKRAEVIRVLLKGSEEQDQATYLTGIRLAESETDVMYDALASKGRWVTQGILFATGKAVLQPESRPVLKEIAGTMKKYGDLKVLIEGHTDNVGSAASNLSLSDARAAAVKAALVSDFGIDGARITTKGLGDTKPAVPNTTAAGKAQNRRVEIVKQ